MFIRMNVYELYTFRRNILNTFLTKMDISKKIGAKNTRILQFPTIPDKIMTFIEVENLYYIKITLKIFNNSNILREIVSFYSNGKRWIAHFLYEKVILFLNITSRSKRRWKFILLQRSNGWYTNCFSQNKLKRTKPNCFYHTKLIHLVQ